MFAARRAADRRLTKECHLMLGRYNPGNLFHTRIGQSLTQILHRRRRRPQNAQLLDSIVRYGVIVRMRGITAQW